MSLWAVCRGDWSLYLSKLGREDLPLRWVGTIQLAVGLERRKIEGSCIGFSYCPGARIFFVSYFGHQNSRLCGFVISGLTKVALWVLKTLTSDCFPWLRSGTEACYQLPKSSTCKWLVEGLLNLYIAWVSFPSSYPFIYPSVHLSGSVSLENPNPN
jgi:hypothetical protein